MKEVYEPDTMQVERILPYNSKLEITSYPYVVKRSLIDGEKDLCWLAMKAKFEQSFNFIIDTSEWFYLPTKAENIEGSQGMDTMGCFSAIIENVPDYQVNNYHLHCTELVSRRKGFNGDLDRLTHFFYLAFPSLKDLKLNFPENHTTKIASPHGITTYERLSEIKINKQKYNQLCYDLIKGFLVPDDPFGTIKTAMEILNEELAGKAKIEFEPRR